MKITSFVLLILLLCLSGAACAPKPAPVIEHATVNAEHASVRVKNSSTSRTLKVVEPGDPVEILEQQDRWYRVRLGEIEGWMEASTIVSDSAKRRIREIVSSAQNQTPQNTGVLVQDGNLRLEPGRQTTILRRLPSRTPVEILERSTLPREDAPGRFEAWLKVRSGPMEVGWLLSSFVEFDVPEGIAPYTEDYVYPAVKVLKQAEDPVLGTVPWYVVAERKGAMDPALDYQGIRVFTWNASRQRYETAFRDKPFRGVYPLEVGVEGGKPLFRIHELSEDGKTSGTRTFVLSGVVVREQKPPLR